MTKNDGGSAFPEIITDKSDGTPDTYSYGGMSLRDWYKGQALGHLSQLLLEKILNTGQHPTPDEIAILSGQIADAMLKERSKNE